MVNPGGRPQKSVAPSRVERTLVSHAAAVCMSSAPAKMRVAAMTIEPQESSTSQAVAFEAASAEHIEDRATPFTSLPSRSSQLPSTAWRMEITGLSAAAQQPWPKSQFASSENQASQDGAPISMHFPAPPTPHRLTANAGASSFSDLKIRCAMIAPSVAAATARQKIRAAHRGCSGARGGGGLAADGGGGGL